MIEKKARSAQLSDLRRQAEEITRENEAQSPENIERLSPEEARQMLHELRVHQIELELQNEELRQAQAERDAAGARYFDFYDLAPVGYFTLSKQGLILEANLTAANSMDVDRRDLVQQPLSRYIFNEDQDIYYLHSKLLFEKAAPQSWEMRLLKKNGTVFWARLEAIAAKDDDGAPVCRTVISDITERKQAEQGLIETMQQLQETMDMLIQFGREAAIGRLAADVAHNILNPACIISSRLQFLEEESLSESARINVQASREQLQRIVKISQDLHQSSSKNPGIQESLSAVTSAMLSK
jgi:PAS domain S-box-containing protein